MKIKKWLITGTTIALLSATAVQARGVEYAKVLEAKPIYKTVRVNTPRQECWTEEVAHQEPQKGQNLGGTLLGGLIGGAVGNQVYRGRDNRTAIATGAVLGAVIGNSASRNSNRNSGQYYVTYEERCRTVNDSHDEVRLEGYDVRYLYNGRIYQTRTPTDPGERIRVNVSVSPIY